MKRERERIEGVVTSPRVSPVPVSGDLIRPRSFRSSGGGRVGRGLGRERTI